MLLLLLCVFFLHSPTFSTSPPAAAASSDLSVHTSARDVIEVRWAEKRRMVLDAMEGWEGRGQHVCGGTSLFTEHGVVDDQGSNGGGHGGSGDSNTHSGGDSRDGGARVDSTSGVDLKERYPTKEGCYKKTLLRDLRPWKQVLYSTGQYTCHNPLLYTSLQFALRTT